MTNPKIEVDIAEVFGEIRQELKSINDRLNKIEVGQVELKANQDNIKEQLSEIKGSQKAQISEIKEQLSEIKGSQKAQIWTLIGILATAIMGILVAGGRILFFMPKT